MAILRTEKSNPEFSRANTTTLTLHSSYISKRQDISIFHHGNLSANTPIVLLLHGVYGSNWVWMELGGAHQVYETLKETGISDFILVMPSDGGLWDGSGYLPLMNHGDYEKWIVDDVIQGVIDNIGGASKQSNIYISGLSMGGYGALRLGAKYPENFKGISAHSSVTSLEDLQQFIENPVSDYVCKHDHEPSLAHWFKINSAQIPPLRLDCGTNDSLYQSNLTLCKVLDGLAIDYQFEALAGGHEWPYWHRNLAKTLLFFNEIEAQY